MSPLFGGGNADGDSDARHRSADERERARQEREARRAAREGRPPRELPPLPDEPPRATDAGAGSVRSGSAPPGGDDSDLTPSAAEEGIPPLPDAPAAPVASPPLAQAPMPIEAPHVVAPPEVYEPATELPPAAEPEPAVHEPATEVAPAAEPAWEPAPADPAWKPAPATQPAAAEPTRQVEPEPAWEPTTTAAQAPSSGSPPPAGAEPTFTDEHPAVVVHGRDDAPAGVKRVAGSPMASAAGASGPPRFGAPPRGVPKRRRGPRRVLATLVLLVVGAAALFAYRLYQPGAGDGEGRVAVTIPQGATAEQIGDLLAERDVVSSGFFFSLRARLDGKNLRAGRVTLKRGMTYAAALTELGKAPPPAPVLAKVTLPEGPGRKDFAPTVKAAGFKGSYTKASVRSNVLDPRDYGAPRGASLEGFLFPATYELKPRSSARALVTQQLRAFKREFAKVDLKTPRARKLDRFDVITIASMIEREALVPKDRRLIAGVIYNRLRLGMTLGIDATTRYELDNFSRPLRVSELERDSPYNTRTRTGLPAGPIGNPGLASLQAAANPARNDFVYYVVKPCANGAHAFSSTDAGFERDRAAYNAKRDELGGKDPSQC